MIKHLKNKSALIGLALPIFIRHRLILGYAARAANVSRDDIIEFIIEQTPIP